jgi:hypothetical protein
MDVEEEEKVACKTCRALLTTRRKAMVKEAAGCPPAKRLKFSKANNSPFGTPPKSRERDNAQRLTALVLAGSKRVSRTGKGTEESASCLRIVVASSDSRANLLQVD